MRTFHLTLPYVAVILGALFVAAGFNLFLVPHSLLSGGVSGISMIIGYATDWNIGMLYFLINLPLIIWGWRAIGSKFIVLSIISVVFTSVFMQLIPVQSIVKDGIIAAVFGGVLIGIGTGISLRYEGSTGGFDILGSIMTRKKDFPLGTILFLLNGSVVFVLGYPNNWDLALSSMLAIFITTKIVDTIHIRHVKVTVFIITNQTKSLLEHLLKIPRGVTIIETKGAYTHAEKDMLMTVTTRYELAALQKIIRDTDPKAFVNIVETVGVMGEFRRKV
ncbi:YitT family protein [Marinicrinis lubricantis]|uniref:YitT family protein n=1 Tax=Marinicrinis lubricantis TaxID=2086470 RepID=A0ABW1IT57_9BACL